MAHLKVVILLAVASCVFANILVKRDCSKTHGVEARNCSRLIVQDLLRGYSGGIPDLGIKALDPIYLDQIEVAEEALGFTSIFPSLRVTGFRNVVVGQNSERDVKETLEYTLKFDFVAEGFINVEFPNKNKVFTGDIKYTGGAIAAISHKYSTKIIHHRTTVDTVNQPGPEQISCTSLHAKSELDDGLSAALQADPDVQAVEEQWVKIEKEHQDRVVCKIAEAVFKVAVNNIIAYARANLLK